ncbi:3-dehydroquinate synthase [Metabacillus arenae]|uniref:3-dehydroquinate synthase n=1 Tax=Metabacillus arenae TaxID=2771434 RepID=A0A926NCG8_9BACI|nr:3-dehydroquinate synthase [Metabacillus arenae]MBD1378610.1 3-dehydroquinate synthase [Metabacillus arenae]
MRTLEIKTTSSKYPVIVGPNCLQTLPDFLKNRMNQLSKILLITDSTVNQLYGDKVLHLLMDTPYPVSKFVVESGEQSKSFQQFIDIQTYALQEKLDRKSLIIALGGGVVGDLAGFVAATFMRGIPYIQIPTTLLAHDSAVGGKVGINHPLGKNMIGAFHQPIAVLYDTLFIKSLPSLELRSGFAEVVKHAFLKGESFLQELISIEDIEMLDESHLAEIIYKGIEVKAEIVGQDEKEAGIRAYLNLGHTLGHAVEAEMGYGKLSHGDCVAVGMLFAFSLSEKVFKVDLNYVKIKSWFKSLGFPVVIPDNLLTEDLISRMISDKKSTSGQINMVLIEKPGSVKIEQFTASELTNFLESWREEELV